MNNININMSMGMPMQGMGMGMPFGMQGGDPMQMMLQNLLMSAQQAQCNPQFAGMGQPCGGMQGMQGMQGMPQMQNPACRLQQQGEMMQQMGKAMMDPRNMQGMSLPDMVRQHCAGKKLKQAGEHMEKAGEKMEDAQKMMGRMGMSQQCGMNMGGQCMPGLQQFGGMSPAMLQGMLMGGMQGMMMGGMPGMVGGMIGGAIGGAMQGMLPMPMNRC
jgi:hypothetical protein